MINNKNKNLKNNSAYSLNSNSNYKTQINRVSSSDMLKNIAVIYVEYLKFILDKFKLRNDNESTFYIKKGFDTIFHVFTTILYYTKNLEIAVYHAHKAYYFYAEFIEQMNDMEFLKLTSNDAAIFVYKKTIYDISTDIKNKVINNNVSEYERNLFKELETYKQIYKKVLLFILNKKETDITYIVKMNQQLYDSIDNISESIWKLFIDELPLIEEYSVDDYFKHIQHFLLSNTNTNTNKV